MGGGMSEQTPQRTTLTINWIGIAGGALAAVTSAVVLAGLRSLGTYGPLLGAAVGSVLASTAAAVYNWSLQRSRERIAEAARRARERRAPNHPGGPEATPPAADSRTREQRAADERADAAADRAAAEQADAEVARTGRRRITHVLLLGVAAFLIAVGGIAVYELTTGTSVAAERQGTVSQGVPATTILGTTVTPDPVPTPTTPAPSPTSSATGTSTASPTQEATDSPTAESTGSPTASQDSSATASPRSSGGETPTSTRTSTRTPTEQATQDPAATATGDAAAVPAPTAG